MQLSRRHFGMSAAALLVAGCGGPVSLVGGGSGRSAPAGLPTDLRPQPDAGYDAWVASFRARATGRGIAQSTLDAAFSGAGFLPGVVTRDRNQTEFKRTLEDYLSIAASDERVAKGRAAFRRHQSSLKAIEARYGVDAQILTAIWGLESFYGERQGRIPVISATSTLAYEGRRGAFFEAQVLAALRIIQNGDIAANRMTGSWAGAMGHTQLIPTTFQEYAVDFTGDGRRDIWSADPSDSIASTANYLARHGWTRGLRWGGEAGAGAPQGRVLQPQAGGPRFVVTRNFDVIKRYNNSDAYALGVGHLADRIAGAGPLQARFPPDQYGLTKDDRVRLQRRLTARGFDAGTADGVIGDMTREAIRGFQRRQGMPVTGEPSQALLQRLG